VYVADLEANGVRIVNSQHFTNFAYPQAAQRHGHTRARLLNRKSSHYMPWRQRYNSLHKRRDTMRYAKLAVALFGFAALLIAADPAIGTWKLNVAKSKYTPGPAPNSATITYEETFGTFEESPTSGLRE